MHIAHMEKAPDTPLAAYLRTKGLTQRQFAAMIGVNQSVVCRFASNAATPKLKTALLIEAATDGEVPVSSWARDE